MEKKSFLQGAFVLGVAGLIIKVMGAVFRIPLANIIGDTGMGYYQTAYPVYVLLLTLSTAGIPVAISRMVAERNALGKPEEAYRVFTTSFKLLLGIGLASFCILFFGARVIVEYLGNPGAKQAMMAISPALLFVPLMASFRGFFQGNQDMGPTAISQIAEQFFRVSIGLFLAIFLARKSLESAASGASFGASAGAVAGLVVVIIVFIKRKSQIIKYDKTETIEWEETSKQIVWNILVIAVPITIGAAIMPIMNTIDVAIVIKRLSTSGFTPAEANNLYGQLTGMAGPLINFPQVLTQAIAMSLVPAVASSFKSGDRDFLRYNVDLGLRTALILGLPSAFGLMILSEPIMLLLYPAQKLSALNAAPSLFILSFGVIFLAMVQTLTGILQGIGKQLVPVRNLAIGAVFKIAVTYILTGVPNINIKGAAFGTVCAYAVASFLNLLAVKKYTGVSLEFKNTLMKPLISVLTMSVIVHLAYKGLYGLLKTNGIATALSIMIGGIVYVLMLFISKAIKKEDLGKIKGGRKILNLLERIKK